MWDGNTKLEEPKAYLRRLLSQALSETRKFWSSHRIAISFATPLIALLLNLISRTGKSKVGWDDLFQTAIFAIAALLCGWLLTFALSFILAPAHLDAESQERIRHLNKQLEAPDKALADHLTDLSGKLSQQGVAILKFLLLYKHPINRPQIKPNGLSFAEVSEALSECKGQTLIETSTESTEMGMAYRMGYTTYYWIPDEFRPTLERLLYKENS